MLQLPTRRIPQGVVQPHRPEPPVPFGVGYTELFRPGHSQPSYPLDVLQPFRGNDRPRRQRRPEPGINQDLEPD